MTVLANKKHEAVALAYLADPEKIGWRAYAKVYGQSSKRSATVAFTRLMTIAAFAARVAETHEQAAQGKVMSAQEVLEGLSELARANMQDYMRVGPDGDPVLDFSSLTRTQAAALQEVTVEDYTDGRGDDARDVKRVKFKLSDKRGALELLGKHHVIFTEKHLHVHEGVADRLAAALARTDGKKHVEKRPDRGAPRARRAHKAKRKGKIARS